MKIKLSPAFVRSSKKYSGGDPVLDKRLETALRRLSNDIFDPRLGTHKLRGKRDGVWSCSVSHDIRILFRFVSDNDEKAILLLTVGSHDEVY